MNRGLTRMGADEGMEGLRAMARSGRFGKYGDLKRKEQIRETRISRSGQGKALLASAKAAQQEDMPGKHRKK